MNFYPLLGALALIYALVVLFIAIKRPAKIWEMKKIQIFRKLLTDKGTMAFFVIWGLGFIGLAVWLFIL
ncbi:MAG: hypothetical protein JXR63_11540 [Spirochaetales bacterium]|nr:hypothetical protein [Spirochaetales bacterium]